MAKIKLPNINEGSLLRRTLLYVGTFVFGTLSFVAIASLIVVSVAKSILPSRGGADTAAAEAPEDADKPAAVAAGAPKPGAAPGTKPPRPRRVKAAPAAPTNPDEAPATN
jgi:hypothetical protein